MADKLRWTPARRRGLAVFVWAAGCNLPVRQSNYTSPVPVLPAGSVPACYWQTITWLANHGLVALDRMATHHASDPYYRLTDAGRAVAAEART